MYEWAVGNNFNLIKSTTVFLFFFFFTSKVTLNPFKNLNFKENATNMGQRMTRHATTQNIQRNTKIWTLYIRQQKRTITMP